VGVHFFRVVAGRGGGRNCSHPQPRPFFQILRGEGTCGGLAYYLSNLPSSIWEQGWGTDLEQGKFSGGEKGRIGFKKGNMAF